MLRTNVWLVGGRIVCAKRILERELKYIAADDLHGAVQGFERWARDTWSDARTVQIESVEKKHYAVPVIIARPTEES